MDRTPEVLTRPQLAGALVALVAVIVLWGNFGVERVPSTELTRHPNADTCYESDGD